MSRRNKPSDTRGIENGHVLETFATKKICLATEPKNEKDTAGQQEHFPVESFFTKCPIQKTSGVGCLCGLTLLNFTKVH
jgi:hypothetical protein